MERPAVKQCTDEDSHMFGAVAVQQSETRWGYIHPETGGGWVTPLEIQDWTDMEVPA